MSDAAGTKLPDPEFPQAGLGRQGYGTEEVDAFVDQLKRALRHDPPTMAPYEVADQRFSTVRLGPAYSMQAVDDYLDRAQELLRERHGEDAVASLEGRAPEQKHVPTTWIYVVALVLVAVIVAFAVTQI